MPDSRCRSGDIQDLSGLAWAHITPGLTTLGLLDTFAFSLETKGF